jgi:hypothetical protein
VKVSILDSFTVKNLFNQISVSRGGFIFASPLERSVAMAEYEGFCLKCKTYGRVRDGKLIKMSNGRTRVAGHCSQDGCTGKISKIIG